jgi:phage terminase large subunit
MQVEVQLPPKLIPVFLGPARYRGAYGGRGSAKTRSFAKMAAIVAHRAAQAGKSGIILCVREFMNSLADSSFAEIKAAIESEEWLRPHFDIGETYIRTICRNVEFVFLGLSRNLNNIKSKAQIILCWADEAEPITETAWEKLIPTVREDESEIWVTWNPEREDSPVEKRFRNSVAPDVKIVEMNYRDNPWFPDVLERERLDDLEKRPQSYGHIWDGEYKTHFEGAYYTEQLLAAKDRITVVPEDPHMIIRLFADIGGTGAKADNFVFWAAQFVGLTIRCVNHYEVQGQPIASHLNRVTRRIEQRFGCLMMATRKTRFLMFRIGLRLRARATRLRLFPIKGRVLQCSALNALASCSQKFGLTLRSAKLDWMRSAPTTRNETKSVALA